jgi:asparagine synthase (glutamine-hydrolysing)
MCGIAGIIAPNVQRYKSALQAMTKSLHHRGPDAARTHLFSNCGLGHRRLSIIDLNTGHQPMLSAVSPCGVTFNGEIYGYKKLRRACQDYPFQTTSDTEVILALYTRHGKRFMTQLPGMFAFGLWDDRTQTLVCARDRFGEKPLYYAFGTNGEFLFASEIKAILDSDLVKPILDRQAVSFYLQRLYVHPHTTIYSNIFTLPPAHMLCYHGENLSVERYWQLPICDYQIDLRTAQEEFRRLLDAAVARQLVADVPVGAFLSGGLDSSTIVALASQHQAKVETFSFSFERGAKANELPFAREVAEKYSTEHVELCDTDTDIGELLLTMQSVYDEPFADSSNIPTYLIAKLARRHIKVVLTGDGGDELLAGYRFWYQPLRALGQVPIYEQLFYRLLAVAVGLSPRLRRRLSTSWGYALEGMRLRQRFSSIAAAHREWRHRFSDDDLRRLGLEPPVENSADLTRYASNTVDDAMRMDIEDYMPGDILVKIDRASMAHGLELRAPFLDVEFASFCISLPARLKITHRTDKYILRQVCADLWPDSLRRRNKQGFGAPVHEWLSRPSVSHLVHDYLENSQRKIYNLLAFDQCRPFVAKANYQTWTLLVLSLWMESHYFTGID